MKDSYINACIINDVPHYEFVGPRCGLVRVTYRLWVAAGCEGKRWIQKRFIRVKPYDIYRDEVTFGWRWCPLTYLRALWYRVLEYPLKRYGYFSPLLLLYKLGLAWWPEGSIVSVKDIFRRPTSEHEARLWRERRFF